MSLELSSRLLLLRTMAIGAFCLSGCPSVNVDIDAGSQHTDGGQTDAGDAGGIDGGTSGGGGVNSTPLMLGGLVVTLVSGITDPLSFVVNDDGLYWVETALPGNICRADLDGSHAVTLFSGQTRPVSIAESGGEVYWVNYGSYSYLGDYNGDGALMAGSIDGGTPVTLASGRNSPASVSVDGSKVYWAESGTYSGGHTYNGNGAVLSEPIDGGMIETLAASRNAPTALAIDGSEILWAEAGTFGSDVPPWPYNNDGAIVKIASDGQSVVTIASSQEYPDAIAARDGVVAWVNEDRSYQEGVPSPDGGTVMVSLNSVNVVASGQNWPYAVTVYEGNAIWADIAFGNLVGSISSVGLGGGTVTTLLSGLDAPSGLQVYNGNLYWLNSSDGSTGVGTICMVPITLVGN